jgi:hypothetical protein
MHRVQLLGGIYIKAPAACTVAMLYLHYFKYNVKYLQNGKLCKIPKVCHADLVSLYKLISPYEAPAQEVQNMLCTVNVMEGISDNPSCAFSPLICTGAYRHTEHTVLLRELG